MAARAGVVDEWEVGGLALRITNQPIKVAAWWVRIVSAKASGSAYPLVACATAMESVPGST